MLPWLGRRRENSTQRASVQTLAITDLKLDEAFQDYGPKAAEGHRILIEGIKNAITEISAKQPRRGGRDP